MEEEASEVNAESEFALGLGGQTPTFPFKHRSLDLEPVLYTGKQGNRITERRLRHLVASASGQHPPSKLEVDRISFLYPVSPSKHPPSPQALGPQS